MSSSSLPPLPSPWISSLFLALAPSLSFSSPFFPLTQTRTPYGSLHGSWVRDTMIYVPCIHADLLMRAHGIRYLFLSFFFFYLHLDHLGVERKGPGSIGSVSVSSHAGRTLRGGPKVRIVMNGNTLVICLVATKNRGELISVDRRSLSGNCRALSQLLDWRFFWRLRWNSVSDLGNNV